MMRVDHERERSRGEQIERCSKYALVIWRTRSLVEGNFHSIYSTLEGSTSTGASRSRV